MATLNAFGKSYACSRAQKGKDFIRLLDGNGNIIFFAEGISDFSSYELVGGSWENPIAVATPVISAHAALVDTLMVLDVPAFANVETGLHLTFVAPCDCTSTTGISIDGTAYTIVDAMGNNILEMGGGAFCLGAVLSVILDVPSSKAYLQNAASSLANSSQVTTELDFSGWDGGSFTEILEDGAEIVHPVTFDAYGVVNGIAGIKISGVS